MSLPNMSGRKTTETADDADTLDAADLLDEDGTVDVNKIKQYTNRVQGGTAIGDDRCQTLRERLATGEETATEVAADFGVGTTTVRNHARGKCACRHDAPAVSFEYGEGWSVDE